MALPSALHRTPVEDEGVVPPSPDAWDDALIHTFSHGIVQTVVDFWLVVFPHVTIHVALPSPHLRRRVIVKARHCV